MKLAIASEDKNIYLFDEQGNPKNKFSTDRGSEVYEIIQILFEQKSEKLAVARSDNLILVYKLGTNWEDKESISQGFNVEAKPNCMIVTKGNQNGIIFGLSNGKVGFLNMDEIYDLKQGATELLNENESENKLTDDDFVFWMSQSCMFCFFRLSDGDNPPIYFYNESGEDRFVKIANSLVEFLTNRLEMSGNLFKEKS